MAIRYEKGHRVMWGFISLPSDLSVPCARASVQKYSPCICLSTGLFERHKLLFSFNMTIKIEQAEGRVPQEELDFFLKGNDKRIDNHLSFLKGLLTFTVLPSREHACLFTINTPVAKSLSSSASRGHRSPSSPQKHFLADSGHLCWGLC